MKLKSLISLLISAKLSGLNLDVFAHEVEVHRRITESAASFAYSNSINFMQFTQSITNDVSFQIIETYLVPGSEREDDRDQDDGGKRPFNHFYDPLSGKGLSEDPPDIPSFNPENNSFVWGSILDCTGVNGVWNRNTFNTRSWPNARFAEWEALTNTYQSDRVANFTNMFRDLGQVIHLLQDLTSPQHVRNEQHLNEFSENEVWKLSEF